MENNIQIKKITSKDWQDYKIIRLEALKYEQNAYNIPYEEAMIYPESYWENYITTALILIAYDKQKPIGLVGTHYDIQETSSYAVITGVYLNKSYRRKGIGKELLTAMIKEVVEEKKVMKVRLWVNIEKEAAVFLYKSIGFKTIGTINAKLGDGKSYDEYIMERNVV